MADIGTPASHNILILPRRIRLFRFFSRPTFRWLFRILARPQLEGFDNIPEFGPYLVTANHPGLADPPMVVAFWPYAVEALGAANMMREHIYGLIMRGYGTFAVQRDSYDLSALRIALQVLRGGRPLLIAPEGTRHPTGMQEARPGAAYLAVKAEVPIVPVGLIGTDRMFATLRSGQRERIMMRVGKPYRLPDVALRGDNRRDVLHEYTLEIMRHIAELLPREYRGVYAANG